jgi:NAD(P)-dependent dehydrogenase (short-subunit alcohol dehydrogenase family)
MSSSARRALVSGGQGGIGRATVAALAAANHLVAVADLDASTTPPGAAEALESDLTDPAACVSAVERTAEMFGGLDVLVHSAGITRDRVTWKLTPEDWDAVMAVNLGAAFHLTRAAIPIMREGGGGAIVYVSSINGERGKFGQSAYAASKAGLHGLAKTVAREVGRFGIRVNVVAPGMVRTPMTATLPEEVIEAAREDSCLGRLAEPEDIAAMIAFLASPQAGHVTGQVIRVDGGQYL